MTAHRPRVLIAPNSFKGTLTAAQATRAMARGVRRVLPGAHLVLLPSADGGDGFMEAILSARGGRRSWHQVPGPLGEAVRAPIGWVRGTPRIAVIEMARCSGLALVGKPGPETALRASSRGLGCLISTALDRGADELLVGIGGSATSDGGSGMASALGYRLLDGAGVPIPDGGAGLLQLERIDARDVHLGLTRVPVRAACDVDNPLLGELGAAAVYGPQKGADQAAVRLLEQALTKLAEVSARDMMGADLWDQPGSGAAGGTGFGLRVFTRATLVAGWLLVAQALGIEAAVARADLVITGEGRFDRQSLMGKAPGQLAGLSAAAGIPCLIFAASGGDGAETELEALGGRLVDPAQGGPPLELSAPSRRHMERLAKSVAAACADLWPGTTSGGGGLSRPAGTTPDTSRSPL